MIFFVGGCVICFLLGLFIGAEFTCRRMEQLHQRSKAFHDQGVRFHERATEIQAETNSIIDEAEKKFREFGVFK